MKELMTAFKLFTVMTLLTGILYPLTVTGIAQLAFPHQANGSRIVQNGTVLGSELVGQQFDEPKYFWGRLSATSSYPFNALSSGGSNLGPTNPALIGGLDKNGKPVTGSLADRVKSLQDADPQQKSKVPADLATASGSGLDPNISVEAADYQIPRVARSRNLPESKVRELVEKFTSRRQFGVLGEVVVNVLELNIALDGERK